MPDFLNVLERLAKPPEAEPVALTCRHAIALKPHVRPCGAVVEMVKCAVLDIQRRAENCVANKCTRYEPLEETVVSKPKLTHIINTKNEGPDVLQTVLSFRSAYDGPYEAVIIDDASQDGSCDFVERIQEITSFRWTKCPCGTGLSSHHIEDDGVDTWHCNACGFQWDSNASVIYIRNEQSVGCGKAKHLGIKAATGDVFIHSDGHCRVLRNDLNGMVERAMAEECILCPGVPPLYTPMTEQAKPDERYKRQSCSYGGLIEFKAKHPENPESPKRLHVNSKWRSKAEYARRTATWWAIFMMSRKTAFERLGGWNKYPGVWGSQEIGLALRAWFADVPIYAVRDVVIGHRYQVDTHYKEYKAELKARGIKNYRTPNTTANHIYAQMMVFDDETIEKVWKPRWKSQWADSKWPKVEKALKGSDLKHQHGLFLKRHKRKTDAEFFETFCPELLVGEAKPVQAEEVAPKAAEMIPKDDVTAVILNYKRPESTQKCVDRIAANGIKNIWVWCQENAEPPNGATRVFTDSENSITWSRYCIAALVPTPWILFCDDDVHLKAAGVDGLLAGAAKYPGRVLGLIGAQFKEPYTSYNRRNFFKSHSITEAVEVDLLWPKGQLIPRDVAQRVFGDARVWQEMRKQTGITRGDDLLLAVALQRAGEKPQLVVPSSGAGYRESRSHSDEFALYKRNLSAKRKMVRRYQLEMGWKTVNMPADYMSADKTEVFDYRWKYYIENIGKRIQQHPDEAREFFHEIETVRPKVFIEVGSAAGGTLYTFAGACEKGATIISVDLTKRYPERRYLKRVVARLREEGYDIHLVRGDSHKPEQSAAVREILAGREADACFIDGDHRASGVRRDWEDYGKLVRAGGIVGFHDIKAKRATHTKVWEPWEKLAKEYKTRDIYAGPAAVGRTTNKPIDVGIGVLYA